MWVIALFACTAAPPDGADSPAGDTDPPPPVRLTALGFNTESGESDPEVVAETIALAQGEVLWGFSEVPDQAAADRYTAAAADSGQRFLSVTGTTGYTDRLVIAWDDDVLAMVDVSELDAINIGGTARAPLVGQLRHRATGVEFLFMVNHLWRTDATARHQQAQRLNAWGADQTLPILAVGDYNFDWDVPTDGETRDRGYDLMTADGVFEWVRPDPLERTQCSRTYDSVLDFTFVGGSARDWPATSSVMVLDRHYCDTDFEERSDHKPVIATVELPP